MKNNLSFKLVVISLFLYCGNNSLEAASGKKYALASPDGKLKVEISTGDKLSYQIMHEKDTILSLSNIGLVLADGTEIGNNKVAVPDAFYKVILINDSQTLSTP